MDLVTVGGVWQSLAPRHELVAPGARLPCKWAHRGRQAVTLEEFRMTALAATSSVDPSRARHAAGAVTPSWKLLLRFALHFRFEYLLRFPSNYAWMVLRRKYDA